MDKNIVRYIISKKNLNSEVIRQLYVPTLRKIDNYRYINEKDNKIYTIINKERIDDNVFLVSFELEM
jgi:hypothetical protein